MVSETKLVWFLLLERLILSHGANLSGLLSNSCWWADQHLLAVLHTAFLTCYNGLLNNCTPMKLDKRIKRGIQIAILSFTLVSTVLLVLTIDKRTLESLKSFKPEFFLLIVIVWFLYRFADGVGISLIARLLGHRISPMKGFEIVLVGLFLSAVTPFQVGAIPMQIYMLHEEGMDFGRATAVMMARSVIYYLVRIPFLPIIFMTLSVSSNFMIKFLLGILLIISFGSIVFYFLFVRRPDILLKLIPSKWPKVKSFLFTELSDFQEGIKVLLNAGDIPGTILVFLVYLISTILLAAIAPLTLYGMGFNPHPLKAASTLILMYSSLISTPTPGGVGVTETVAAALFSDLCPKYAIGIFVILLRLFTFYIGAILGGITFFRKSLTLEPLKRKE